MHKPIHLDTITIGSHFLPALINGDLSGLEPGEEFRLEEEHGHYISEAAYAHPNRDVATIIYDPIGEESHFARCQWCGLMADCYDVNVIALVSSKTHNEG